MTKQLVDYAIQLDEQEQIIIQMWMHGKSHHSQRQYRRVVQRFYQLIGKSLKNVGLQDLQIFDISLNDLSDYSRKSYIAALKSLISFSHKIGFISVNVGATLQPPKVKNTLSERILTEEEVKQLITHELNVRNRIMIRFLYATGLRVSELCQLKWNNIKEVKGGAVITVFGKDGKTRTIWISTPLWEEVKRFSQRSPISNRYSVHKREKDSLIHPKLVEL